MVVGGSGLGLGIDPCSRFRFCYFWNENKEAVKKEKGHFPSRQKFHPLARGESGAHGRGWCVVFETSFWTMDVAMTFFGC